jgi:hypothetical protein
MGSLKKEKEKKAGSSYVKVVSAVSSLVNLYRKICPFEPCMAIFTFRSLLVNKERADVDCGARINQRTVTAARPSTFR